MTATDIPRDRYGRPLIVPPEGGDPTAYTRPSTMAKTLDDLNNLMAWKQRKTAEGLLRRPDLLTRIAGIIANGNPDTHWPTKRELNNICDEATEAAGASKGSSAGTGFHHLTEAIDRGEEPLAAPQDIPRLDAYREAIAAEGISALEMEMFVVNDEVRAAGTFDRLWQYNHDGRVVIGDLKSGKSEADYPLGTTIQMAIYANAKRYDPATGERTPIHPNLDPTVGLLVHMPPSGGCRVIPLDLVKGWEAAKVAAYVHQTIRKWKPADLYATKGVTA